ncbi:polysaccharide biosynthesis C-terminal domain-containing protein, partial [Chlamydiota bacterium]
KIFTEKYPPKKETIPTKKIISFSLVYQITVFLNRMFMWTDIFFLGYLTTSYEVGLYSVPIRISLLGSMVLRSMNKIFSPVISDLYKKDKIQEIRIIFQTIIRWVAFCTLPFYMVLIFYAKNILAMVGPQYKVAYLCLMVSAIGQMINSLTGSVGVLLSMSKYHIINLVNNVSMILFNILLNYFLIKKYSYFGAALATALTIGIVNIIRMIEVRIFFKIFPYGKGCYKPFLALGLSILTTKLLWYLFKDFYTASLPLFLEIMVFLSLYICFMCLLRFERIDRLLFEKIKKKVLLLKSCIVI